MGNGAPVIRQTEQEEAERRARLSQVPTRIPAKPDAADLAPDLKLQKTNLKVDSSKLDTLGFRNPQTYIDFNGNAYVTAQKYMGNGLTAYLYVTAGTSRLVYIKEYPDGSRLITGISASSGKTLSGQNLLGQLSLDVTRDPVQGLGYRVNVNTADFSGYAEAFLKVVNDFYFGVGYQQSKGPGGSNYYFTFGKRVDAVDYAILVTPKNIQYRIEIRPDLSNKENLQGASFQIDSSGNVVGGIRYKLDNNSSIVVYSSGKEIFADLIQGTPDSYFTFRLGGKIDDPKLSQVGVTWTKSPKGPKDHLIWSIGAGLFNEQLNYFVRLGYQFAPQGLALETTYQSTGGKGSFGAGLSIEPVKGIRVGALWYTAQNKVSFFVNASPYADRQNQTIGIAVIDGKPQAYVGFQQQSKDKKTTTSIYFSTTAGTLSGFLQYSRDLGDGKYVTGQYFLGTNEIRAMFGRQPTGKGLSYDFLIREKDGIFGYLAAVNLNVSKSIYLRAEFGNNPNVVGSSRINDNSFRIGLGGEILPGTHLLVYYDLKSGVQFALNTSQVPRDQNGALNASVAYYNGQVYFGLSKELGKGVTATVYFNSSGKSGLVDFTWQQLDSAGKPTGFYSTVRYDLNETVHLLVGQRYGKLTFDVQTLFSPRGISFLADVAAEIAKKSYIGVAYGSSSLAGGTGSGSTNLYAYFRYDVAQNVSALVYWNPHTGISWSVNTYNLFKSAKGDSNTWLGIGGSPTGMNVMMGIREGDFVLGAGSGGVSIQYKDFIYTIFDPITGRVSGQVNTPPLLGPFGLSAVFSPTGVTPALTVGRLPILAWNPITNKIFIPGGLPTIVVGLLLNFFLFAPMEKRERQRLEFLARQQQLVIYDDVTIGFKKDVNRRGKETFTVTSVNVINPTPEQIQALIAKLGLGNITLGKAEKGYFRMEIASADNSLKRVFLLSPDKAQAILSAVLGDDGTKAFDALKDKTTDSVTLNVARSQEGNLAVLQTLVERFNSRDEVERALREQNEEAHRHKRKASFKVGYTIGGNRLITITNGEARALILKKEEAQEFLSNFFKISELTDYIKDPTTDTMEATYEIKSRGWIWGRTKFIDTTTLHRTQLPADNQDEMNAFKEAIRSVGRSGTIQLVHSDDGKLIVTVRDSATPDVSSTFILTDSEANKVLIELFETHIFRHFRDAELKKPQNERHPLILSFVERDKGDVREWVEPPTIVSYSANIRKKEIELTVLA